MTFTPATISGSILDFLDGVQSARVTGVRLEGGVSDGDDARLGGLDVQYSSTKTTPELVVATGTYAIVIQRLAGGQPFKKRSFTAPITGDTSWGEVLSYDGTGYEYTPDELARLVAVEQAIAGGISGAVPDATTTVKGKVELATNGETTTGTDTTRAVTPAGLTAAFGGRVGALEEAATGYAAHSTTGSLTLAGTGMHVLTLTGDTVLALTGSNGASVALVVHLNGHTLTVEGQEVEADGLALLYKAEGTWVLAGTSGGTTLTPTTPAFPLTYTDDGTTRTYVIPTTTGVDYKVGGTTQTAGTKTATPDQAITVTPVAQAGYVLTSSTPWTHAFAGTTPDTTPPTAPSLDVNNSSQTQLVATITGGTDAVGVTQYRSRIDGGSWFTGTPKTFAGLSASTSHTIDAQAGDAAGNWSISTSDTKSTASAAATPHDTIMADSPSLYFPLDDAPGTTNPHNDGSLTIPASAQGSPTFTGSVLNLNGAAQHIRMGAIEYGDTASPFNGCTSFTLEAVLEYGDGAYRWFGHTFFFSSWTSSGSNVHVYLNGADAAYGAISGAGPHHFAIRYDGTTLSSYIDGVENGSMAATGTTSVPDGWIGIGGVPTFTQWFIGNISHFAFYRNVALSTTRITAHAQAHGLA